MARYIDADALIENIKRVYCTDCNNYNEVHCRACGTDDAMAMIEDAPTADVAPRADWISVEERLPEESCECLCVSRTGEMYLVRYSRRYKAFNATDDDDGDRWKLGGFTHWMPLPESPVIDATIIEPDTNGEPSCSITSDSPATIEPVPYGIRRLP